MGKIKEICLFCSSSNALDENYYTLAANFGQGLAQKGYNLTYGGANVGLMEAAAKAASAGGSHITGVIPEAFAQKGLSSGTADNVIFVKDLNERKKVLVDISDAFVALPGGFGTLDELLEVITLKQTAFINKPIIILNYNGFYDYMLKQFDVFFQENFAKPQYREIYFVAYSVDDIFAYLDKYEPKVDKDWFRVDKKDFD